MEISKVKVLLAEDDKDLLEIFSLKLKISGFNLLTATNGQDALDLIKKEKPDLVLLDLVMPEMDGYQVLTALGKDKSLKGKTLVYVWSNLTQNSEIEKAKKLGADGYLIKSDYTPSKLVEKIAEILKVEIKK